MDTETKRRIDTARDILVGKVPDPKSQVEQITLALIYKFMDDMDAEAEELGGKRTFFSGDFERYGWAKLMDVSLGAQETLNRYAEAIEKMKENQNVPQLFRDIFKNAFLPYRDPETLKAFLKIIDDFEYDHSERLGDAYEYLLSVMSSQGDAGQFRTPRHIIDFMVKLVEPKKEEKVLDPACGTAGFLISAYKFIMEENRKAEKEGKGMTPDERARLMTNFEGYDISPDMVRLSLVNLYLHGFQTPKIYEYDTLTSEDRWNDFADVILANPPFMSPKGGIRPHKRFSVESNRSEVLFVDYILEHQTPNGRAAVIVPEGVIFQGGIAYKALRKMLVEQDYLVGVISLPAGVFNPYSGVKTSILWIDRAMAKKANNIVFCRIETDGFDLGAQRRANLKNDLPGALVALTEYKRSLIKAGTFSADALKGVNLVEKKRLAEGGEYNLSEERYKATITRSNKFKMIPLGEVAEFTRGPFGSSIKRSVCVPKGTDTYKVYEQGNVIQKDFIRGEYYITREQFSELKRFELLPNDIVLTCAGTLGKTCVIPEGIDRGIINSVLMRIRVKDYLINRFYLEMILKSPKIQGGITDKASGVAIKNLFSTAQLKQFTIPLPSLKEQEEIIAEVNGYQKIIDGARMVVENYRPRIEVDPSWKVVKLGEVADFKYGFTATAQDKGNARFIRITDIDETGLLRNEGAKYIDLDGDSKKYLLNQNDLLVARTGATYGKTLLWNRKEQAVYASYLIKISFRNEVLLPNYYWAFTQSVDYDSQKSKLVTGGGQPQFNANVLKYIEFPLPDKDKQAEIINQIEKEMTIINSNKELIRIYEKKIQARVAKVWGE